MNYTELTEDIATRLKRGKSEAKRDLDTFIATLRDALRRGEEVRLPGLGTLSVDHRRASKGRNPRTGDPIDIPARRAPKFRPARALVQLLNPPQPAAAEKRRRA